MNNSKMFNFIEGYLCEPLSNKEKKRLSKLAQQREQRNKYAFIEKHLGEPLSIQNKATLSRLEKVSARYDMAKAEPQLATKCKWKFQQNFLWRYCVTAIASIAICLSIVLPITLGNAKSVPYPVYIDNTPPVEIPRYTDNIQELALEQGVLNTLDGLLLFNDQGNKNQYCPKDETLTDFYFGTTKVESSKKDERTLSYLIDNCWIAVDLQPITAMEVFAVDYRIRTYKYYYFEDYYKDFYATLEKTYNDNKTNITDESKLYDYFGDIKKIYDPDKTQEDLSVDVFAFVHNDIKVFFTIELGVAFVYFEHDGNDYFIKATPIDFFAVTGKEFTPDAEYIKDEFIIKTLFANLSNA